MAYGKPKPMPFEKSKRDMEPRGMREGSKREEAYDGKQKAKGKMPPAKMMRGMPKGR